MEKEPYTGAVFAGVAEWYTRTTQNRVSQGVRVRVPPPAQQTNEPHATHGAILFVTGKGRESRRRYTRRA